MTQAEKDPAVGVLQVEVDTDDVELSSLRCLLAQQPGRGRRAAGGRMLGGVPANEVTETGAQVEPFEHVRGEPPQQHALVQVHRLRVATPTALEDRARLKEVLARCPEMDKAGKHVRDFGEILTDRLGSTIPTWIDAAGAGQLPGLIGFALHLLRDLDAVKAGLTLDWSSGSIEGAVNRIKKIKRQL
ncbi:hypothetical protein [Streptomyces griseosporeus]|uniref:hypothetical protein n=1 Tax=Streptomyces griseosporeus TaxID=1910 RepID=UPI00367E06CD